MENLLTDVGKHGLAILGTEMAFFTIIPSDLLNKMFAFCPIVLGLTRSLCSRELKMIPVSYKLKLLSGLFGILMPLN